MHKGLNWFDSNNACDPLSDYGCKTQNCYAICLRLPSSRKHPSVSLILLNLTRQPFRYIVGAIVTASYNILYSLVSYTTSKYEVKLLKGRSP
mgnify:CR=1 FL=1